MTIASTSNVSTTKSINSPSDAVATAAVKFQNAYKSYRTRRNLADCAVVIEELWWRALDFASLSRTSISFFDNEKPETPHSRWARAGTRAAKVGKGLLKDDKAQKLALCHWLEAIDPRHRYGHNLHLYYNVWFQSESHQPFFYWLDVGEGKEVSLEKCPRIVLNRQCIEYLGPNERMAYEVVVESGKLVYRKTGEPVNTKGGSKWIFVLSTTKELYVGRKRKGIFHHSSFLAGAATSSAGRLVVRDGSLEAVWPYSGHYRPTEENFHEFVYFLEENKLDLTNVRRLAIDDDSYQTAEDGESVYERVVRLSFDGAPGIRPPTCMTGAGPRVERFRDHSIERQSSAFERVNLSLVDGLIPLNGPLSSLRPNTKHKVSSQFYQFGLVCPINSIAAQC